MPSCCDVRGVLQRNRQWLVSLGIVRRQTSRGVYLHQACRAEIQRHAVCICILFISFVCFVSCSRTLSYLLSVCFYRMLLQSSSCSLSRNICCYICIYLHVLIVHYFPGHFNSALTRSCLSCITHVFIRLLSVCVAVQTHAPQSTARSSTNKLISHTINTSRNFCKNLPLSRYVSYSCTCS